MFPVCPALAVVILQAALPHSAFVNLGQRHCATWGVSSGKEWKRDHILQLATTNQQDRKRR